MPNNPELFYQSLTEEERQSVNATAEALRQARGEDGGSNRFEIWAVDFGVRLPGMGQAISLIASGRLEIPEEVYLQRFINALAKVDNSLLREVRRSEVVNWPPRFPLILRLQQGRSIVVDRWRIDSEFPLSSVVVL